ncbi:dihydroxy-acid dehydratase [Salipiger mangrovisoli]|uniref:Dihydroxy-acid dehydratase n=1 Tax=Salipiger mangrovisoli TaxID=2865933 RepID=A0ABR9WXT5_9RHOB|nr:dihydroxy-acid dehydratase [Salipiger mangrovisoli]MBE9636091.1 dihydroxy-acid dehydratase [Salipiger mangrovisoli]
MIAIPGKGRALRRRCCAALLAFSALASCDDMTGKGRPPLLRAPLEEGAVVVAGPGGYCIDPVTLDRRAGQGFAVLASCQILSGGETGAFVDPMMLTVTVGAAGASGTLPSPATMAAEAGQQAISGSALRGGLSLVHLASGGNRVLPEGDPRYWRGAFRLNGRLVLMALYAPRDGALAGSDGAEMLRAVHARMVALSPEAAAQR